MTNRINILDPITANQIAAGEVVERPASVIKELVENSIDAGSSRIAVEVGDSVIDWLRVTDNGNGINKNDLPLALQRHATSKISSIEDLNRLQTLGFRGEALPSIASVCEMELASRIADNLEGWKLFIKGGNILSETALAMPVGTDIVVKNLFFNTPARKKHMKSESTELGHIKDMLLKFALAYPQIAFKFAAGGSRQWQTDGNGDYFQPLILNYGEEIASKMVEINYENANGSVRLHGFLAPPSFTRTTRIQQIIFVNRRLVRSRLISSLVEKCLNTLLPNNRYPIFCLFLEINPTQIDVNVHPTKMEIRFSDEYFIADVIDKAIKEQFINRQNSNWVINKDNPKYEPAPKTVQKNFKPQYQMLEKSESQPLLSFTSDNQKEIHLQLGEPTEIYPSITNSWRIIGQLFNSYVIVEENKNLVLIDQHAAHERILFEKFIQDKEFRNQIQPLLYPETLTLNPLVFQTLIDKIFLLQEFGYLIEHFGQNTVLMRAIPHGLSINTAVELFNDLLELIADKQFENVQKLQEKWLILRACKTAIKAKQKLTFPEMEALIQQLDSCKIPVTCPHGRPIRIEWQLSQLEQLFKRT